MPFAAVYDLAAFLRRTFTVDEEATAQLLLELATGEIRGYTRQYIAETEHTQYLFGTWGPDLELPQRPVTAVDTVTVEGTAIDDLEWDMKGTLRRHALDGLSWPGDSPFPCGHWGGPRTTIQVVYTAGYAEIPDDIRNACLTMAASAFANPEGISQETVGGYSVSYRLAVAGVTLTDDQRRTLRRYR